MPNDLKPLTEVLIIYIFIELLTKDVYVTCDI